MVVITNQGSLTWSNATEGLDHSRTHSSNAHKRWAATRLRLPAAGGSWRAQPTAGAAAGLGAAERPPPLTLSWYSLSNCSCSACCSSLSGSISRMPHTSYSRQADNWAGRQLGRRAGCKGGCFDAVSARFPPCWQLISAHPPPTPPHLVHLIHVLSAGLAYGVRRRIRLPAPLLRWGTRVNCHPQPRAVASFVVALVVCEGFGARGILRAAARLVDPTCEQAARQFVW